MKHLAHLKGVFLGRNHVAFKLQKYEMDLRDYIEDIRDVRYLTKAFQMIILGLKELNELGFVHRDLKPENVLINQRPLHVTLIDFERATLRVTTKGPTVKGTVGYFPVFKDLRDGSTRWDVWALSAMILEADMTPGEYRNVANERGALFKA